MSGDLAFITLAINPIGGLLIAIPFAILKLGYPAWLAVVEGVPLAYVQVIVVDLAWSLLRRWGAFNRFLERQRSPRIERLMASRGAFWSTFFVAPTAGPWVVMAFMRYAQVPQRKIALPVLLGISVVATIVAVLCVVVPQWFHP
jgi:hypothetical protein